ncbi:MAG: glycosyltransferase family 2 protein [Kiloniellaceae bacterium]
MNPLDLSVIVPVYNEEANVEPLYEAVIAAVEPLGLSFELLLVDDGSADDTFPAAARLAARDGRVRVIKFRRNYGQTAAMVAGIDHARGRTLVTMDGDLQNDPADISKLLEKIDEGYDIVAGWRRRRQDKFISRVLPSKVANWLIGKVTGVPIKDNGCSLKAYRADLIKNIPLYSEMHRFIPAMTSLAGARIAQIPVRHHPRRFGVSKYGISRVYKVLFDLLTIKSVLILATRPLFAFTGATVLSGVFAVAMLGAVAIQAFITGQSPNMVLIALGLLVGALSLFLGSLGLLAQLVYKTGNITAANLSALTATFAREVPRAGAGRGP